MDRRQLRLEGQEADLRCERIRHRLYRSKQTLASSASSHTRPYAPRANQATNKALYVTCNKASVGFRVVFSCLENEFNSMPYNQYNLHDREKMGTSKPKTLNVLEDALHVAALELVETDDEGNFDEALLQKRLDYVLQQSKRDCINSSLRSYSQISQKALPTARKQARRFERRTFKRWKPAFDHLEMMWHVAQELGEAHSREFDHENPEDTHLVMSAISNIFPKALLVTQEILCLLKGGYPDGALARWRSLHELTVTAMYILQEGRGAAISYIMSFHFAARRAAKQLNEHSERAGLDPFSDEQMANFDHLCAEAEKLLGRKIDKDRDGEWPSINLNHRNFADIERHVDMDHWRPRYKWASRHTHADHSPNDKLLGMSEAKEPLILVGASNSGFADPFMMTAISLAQITNTFLSVTPNFDRVVHSSVMSELSEKMNEIATQAQDKTHEAHLRTHSLKCRFRALFGFDAVPKL